MAEETRRRGTEPPDYIGVKDHGPDAPTTRGPRRMLVSAVWGGGGLTVTTEHASSCDYCGSEWPNSVCMDADTHPGMDIGMNVGTSLFSAERGTVEFAGWGDFYRPHHVDIRTPDGNLHIYGHMWSVEPDVVAGGTVEAGQLLGTSGEQTVAGTMDPDGTGGHIHFETRGADGCAFSPEQILVDAPIGGEGGQQLNDDDRIEVIDGPLQMRERGNLQAEVLDSLATGTILVVTGGPVHHDGFTWYRVRIAEGEGHGWVAGKYCRLAG